MRKVICALIIAVMALALAACNGEHRVKIKDGEVILADVGLKVTLPKGWVVFDTEDAWGKGGMVHWNTQYSTFYLETDDRNPFRGSRFLMAAEKPDGGIAMVLGVGAIPENMDMEFLTRRINDSAMMVFEKSGFSAHGTVELFPEYDYTELQGFLSTVEVTRPDGETDFLFTITDYIFTYKDYVCCMEIYAEESSREDGKNIQISPAEL